MYTSTDTDQVIQLLAPVLDRPLTAEDKVTCEEGEQALERLEKALAAGERLGDVPKQGPKAAAMARDFDGVMRKVRLVSGGGDWRQAWRNLNYFMSENYPELDTERALEGCGECLRYGFRGNATVQELVGWMDKAISRCVADESAAGVEEALDFIDAYGEKFWEKGEGHFIKNQLVGLQELIDRHGLQDKAREVNEGLPTEAG